MSFHPDRPYHWSLLHTPWLTRDTRRANPRYGNPTPFNKPLPLAEPQSVMSQAEWDAIPVEPPHGLGFLPRHGDITDGYVIYEGPSLLNGVPIVVIATGFKKSSKNTKTGAMVQTWILLKDMPPQAALDSGADEAICGDCPARGEIGELPRDRGWRAYIQRGRGWQRGPDLQHVDVGPIGRTCYVAVSKAPNGIWWKYHKGGYPVLQDPRQLAAMAWGRAVRIGTYGDPAAVPAEIWDALVAGARIWTGYTHQWRLPQVQALRGPLMASVDSIEEMRQAHNMGWRTFRVREHGGEIVAGHEIVCPASEEAGFKTTCDQCAMCQGTQARSRKAGRPISQSIVIQSHGFLDPESNRKRAEAKRQERHGNPRKKKRRGSYMLFPCPGCGRRQSLTYSSDNKTPDKPPELCTYCPEGKAQYDAWFQDFNRAYPVSSEGPAQARIMASGTQAQRDEMGRQADAKHERDAPEMLRRLAARKNPWTKDGFVDAFLRVQRPGVEWPVWEWQIGDYGEEDKPKQIRDALMQAAQTYVEFSGVAAPGDVCELHYAGAVTRLRVIQQADGRLALAKE